ncbi:SulP family inorganic anion transporter [Opitutales bacterium]|uniref:SulP family inorganic anion transporter n=1 Tax=Candidatus Chordibacter forsetii TaxID=3381758 RepID=UPI0023704B60|nr:SulP family inorganic anion transporter [Opitutales bacterium]
MQRQKFTPLQNLFIPKIPGIRKGLFSNPSSNDLKAGINVALLAIPQGMAYALVAGLPIHYGLLGSAVAALIGGIFGGGRFITLGPTNATAVLLFGAFASVGLIGTNGLANSSALLLLPVILFTSGLFLVLASLFRISFIVQFVSRTVITGYITAAACLIIANQGRHVMGISTSEDTPPSTFLGILFFLITHLDLIAWPAIILSAFTAAVYLLIQLRSPALPSVAGALIAASIAGHYMENAGFSIIRLESFSIGKDLLMLPSFDLLMEHGPLILSTSLAVCLLCLLEGLSIGKSLSARAGGRIDSNQETFAIGMGNLGCSLFSGMPASGSLTRSTLSVASGARTNLANLITGLVIFIGVFALNDLVRFIPICSLATLVIFIGISLVKIRQIRTVARATRSDAFAFAVTLLVGLAFSLQLAIFAGVLTSVLLFLRKVAQPQLIEYGYTKKGDLAEASALTKRAEPEVFIVHVEGELFFAAADLFYEQIRRVGEDPNQKVLVLKMLNAHNMDATSVLALEELLEYLSEKDCHVILCEIRKDCLRILKNSGALSRMNRRNIFPFVPSNPTLSTAKAIRRAKSLVKGGTAKVTILADEKKKF